jgi:hypothetical protein
MATITSVATDGHTATLDVQRQVVALERTATGGLRWAWLLVALGLAVMLGAGAHGYTAYTTIARIDIPAQINTPNPFGLFQDITTNGPRVGNTVENSQRANYTKALEQYVLDGTVVALGLAVALAGLFIRWNR